MYTRYPFEVLVPAIQKYHFRFQQLTRLQLNFCNQIFTNLRAKDAGLLVKQ